MDLKNIEISLKVAFNDKRLKLRDISDKYKILDKVESLLTKITKLNDALGELSYLQSYYSDIFSNNKQNYADFNFNCNDLQYTIEDEQDELIFIFNDFIKELYDNDDLQELLKEDFPNTIKILNRIKEYTCCYSKLDELIDWYYKILTYLSYEEDNLDKVYQYLDKQMKEYYNTYLKEDI